MDEKISVKDFVENNEMLELTYIPFDTKMNVVSHTIQSVIDAVGGLNTTLLRRVFIEAVISTITNIDMTIRDENDLVGFDQLLYTNNLNTLIDLMGGQYDDFKTILEERVNDYIRIETNPSVTINQIYNQVKEYFNTAMNYISEKIQEVDVEQLSKQLAPLVEKVGEMSNES